MASVEFLPRLRSDSSAKSTIMMPFLVTMPISRMMPMSPTTFRPWPNRISASSAPTPADGSVDRMVTGWMKLSYKTPSTI
jgi:hypothetical protein